MKSILYLILSCLLTFGCSDAEPLAQGHAPYCEVTGAGGATATSTETTSTTGSAGSAGSAGAGGAPTQPNILLIIVDDMGVEASSLYPALAGQTGQVPMPNVEALAAQGLVFDRAYSAPLCSPTRSTIVSGRYGHHTGVLSTGEFDALPIDTLTVFDRLSAETDLAHGFFGKYHIGGNFLTDDQHVYDIGIEHFAGTLVTTNYYGWRLHETGVPGYTTVADYSTTVFTDKAIAFINAQTGPWFSYVSYNAAHTPLQVPPAHLHSVNLNGAIPGTTLSTLANYKAIIQSADTEIGRLLESVDLEETTVIVTADNGTPTDQQDGGRKLRGA